MPSQQWGNQNTNPWGDQSPYVSNNFKKNIVPPSATALTEPVTPPDAGPVGPYTDAYGNPSATPSTFGDLQASVGQGNRVGVPQLVQSMPTYSGITDAQGNLSSPYYYDPNNSASFAKMNEIANSDGPTSVYRDQAKAISLNTNQNLNRLGSDQNSAYQTSLDNVASTGGLDAGSVERLNRGAQQSKMNASSNVYGQGAAAKANALANDSSMKMGLLGQTASGETAGQQYNIQNAMGDNANKYNADLNSWNTLGNIVGSGNVADEMTPGASKKDPISNHFMNPMWSPEGFPMGKAPSPGTDWYKDSFGMPQPGGNGIGAGGNGFVASLSNPKSWYGG